MQNKTRKGYEFPPHSTKTGRDADFATRQAVKHALEAIPPGSTVLVALSGGADSLALAAAVSHVAPKLGLQAGSITINHNLQSGSLEVAQNAQNQAIKLGLHPALLRSVDVDSYDQSQGPESVAREARYAEFTDVLEQYNAQYILTAHTTNDNAEQVLLGLLRGSGTRSLAGIPAERGYLLRPFVDSISREQTEQACIEQNLTYWVDPHNSVLDYTRVRVRKLVIPFLQEHLGKHVPESLNRTAEIAKEDADALDSLAQHHYSQLVRPVDSSTGEGETKTTVVAVKSLEELPAAIQHRIIRLIGSEQFGEFYTREHVLLVMRLITHWKGQKGVQLPGTIVTRKDGNLTFERNSLPTQGQ